MKLKKMINASLLALGMMGALAATTPASALDFGLPVAGPPLGSLPLS